MKKWNVAEINELDLTATAYGKNLNANEANANKHKNNGAGGSLLAEEFNKSDDEDPVTPNDMLS